MLPSHNNDPPPAGGGDAGGTPLRRQHEPAPAPSPDSADAPFAATRLTVLAHDLANLLDGSLRTLILAQRSLHSVVAGTALDPSVAHRIQTVHAALEQMAELVRSAMSGVQAEAPLGRRPGLARVWSLAAAAGHAVEVMRSMAEEAGVRLDASISIEAHEVEAGPIYPVLAAAVRNALEAVQRAGQPKDGSIEVRVMVERAVDHPGGMVLIEVVDNGVGPPLLPPGKERSVFDLGFTTKRIGGGGKRSAMAPPASGIGLAMALETVRSLGGWIELLPRHNAAGRGQENTRGAVLRIRYPMLASRRGEANEAA